MNPKENSLETKATDLTPEASLDFPGWGTAEKIEDLDQESSEKESKGPPHARLTEWQATAICGNDITSSCLYVSAICALWAGPLAPVALLAVAGLLYLFRFIYAEVGGALPLNGGAYNVLLNTTTKKWAAAAACLTLLSYVATAVISAGEAMHYGHNLWHGMPVFAATIGLIGFFAFLNLLGISESAVVAMGIFGFHMATLVMLVLVAGSIVIFNSETLMANWALPMSAWPTPYESGGAFPLMLPLFFGFSAAMLGVSGFESSANFIEEQEPGVFPKTLRNMWIAVAVFNPLISLLSLGIIPLATLSGRAEDLLAYMGAVAGYYISPPDPATVAQVVSQGMVAAQATAAKTGIALHEIMVGLTAKCGLSNPEGVQLLAAQVKAGGISGAQAAAQAGAFAQAATLKAAQFGIQGAFHGGVGSLSWLAGLLNTWISADALLVLSGAVLTSYVGVIGLVRRMSLDLCLPQFLLKTNRWRGTNHWIILSFFALCCSIQWITSGDIQKLAGVYTLSFLSVMALFALGNMLLKIHRDRLPRDVRASWASTVVALAGVLLAWFGNYHMNPEYFEVFMMYFVISLLLVGMMFMRVQVLKSLLKVIRGVMDWIDGVTDRIAHRVVEQARQIREQVVVVFVSNDDPSILNLAARYVLENEEIRHLRIVHVYSSKEGIPVLLGENLKTIDRCYPQLKIDLVLVQGEFGPELIDRLSRRLGVPKNYMFIGTPGDHFPHQIESLGGVRLIM
jgi:amino acid transporter